MHFTRQPVQVEFKLVPTDFGYNRWLRFRAASDEQLPVPHERGTRQGIYIESIAVVYCVLMCA